MEEDWRLQGQGKYLKYKKLIRKKYVKASNTWDHDHCEFCGDKFSESGEDDLRLGYTTLDGYHWICNTCFHDFKKIFAWKLIDHDDEENSPRGANQ